MYFIPIQAAGPLSAHPFKGRMLQKLEIKITFLAFVIQKPGLLSVLRRGSDKKFESYGFEWENVEMCSSLPVTPQTRKKLPRLEKMEERQAGENGRETGRNSQNIEDGGSWTQGSFGPVSWAETRGSSRSQGAFPNPRAEGTCTLSPRGEQQLGEWWLWHQAWHWAMEIFDCRAPGEQEQRTEDRLLSRDSDGRHSKDQKRSLHPLSTCPSVPSVNPWPIDATP